MAPFNMLCVTYVLAVAVIASMNSAAALDFSAVTLTPTPDAVLLVPHKRNTTTVESPSPVPGPSVPKSIYQPLLPRTARPPVGPVPPKVGRPRTSFMRTWRPRTLVPQAPESAATSQIQSSNKPRTFKPRPPFGPHVVAV